MPHDIYIHTGARIPTRSNSVCPNTAASQRVSIRGGCGKGGEQFVGSAYFALVKVMRLITSKPALFRKATT